MQIVGNMYVLKYFQKIEYFEMDLGWNVKEAPMPGGGPPKIKFKDSFIKEYFENFGRHIFKLGKISFIDFYDDIQLTSDELFVFKDDKIYEIKFGAEYKAHTRKFLSDLLESINNNVIEHTSELAKNLGDNIVTNMGDIERPDISLPYDQYLEAMLERQRKLRELNER